MQYAHDNGQGGPGDEMAATLAVFSTVDELSNTAVEAVLASSPQLDRDVVRRYMAQALLRAVARVMGCGHDDYLNDEDSVLRDAARDMGEWIDRLPSESPWTVAFGQSRSHLLETIG